MLHAEVRRDLLQLRNLQRSGKNKWLHNNPPYIFPILENSKIKLAWNSPGRWHAPKARVVQLLLVYANRLKKRQQLAFFIQLCILQLSNAVQFLTLFRKGLRNYLRQFGLDHSLVSQDQEEDVMTIIEWDLGHNLRFWTYPLLKNRGELKQRFAIKYNYMKIKNGKCKRSTGRSDIAEASCINVKVLSQVGK